MYVEHFRLRADPFKVTPDSQFYFRGERQRAAEVDLLAALEQPDGLVLLGASAGCGKTLLLRQAAEQLKPKAPVAMVWNPALPFEDLLASVCAQFGVNEPADDVPHRMRSIEFLAQHALSEGHVPVVMIDDADNLPDQTLDRLMELCELRIKGRQALGLVLTSDLGGCDLICEQLPDHIAVQRVTLAPLAGDEVTEYVQHRLRVAGAESQSLFTRAALARLADISRGVPRLVNVLAGKALFVAYLGDEREVGEDLVEEVAGELWSTIESDLPPASAGRSLADRMECHPAVNGRASPPPPPVPAAAPTKTTAETSVTAEEVLVDLSRLARTEVAERASSAAPVPPGTGSRRPVATPLLLALLAVVVLGAFLSTEFGQDWSRDRAQPMFDDLGHTLRDRMSVRDVPMRSGTDQTDGAGPDDSVAVLPVPVVADSPRARRPDSVEASGQPVPESNSTDAPRAPSNPAPRPTVSFANPSGESWVDSLDGGRARIRRLLGKAVAHLNAGHYTDPAGDNALEDYRRVLELDPGNLLATRGIEALLGRLVRWGRVAESRGDWEAAVDYYQAAVHIDPESDELQSALRRTRRLNNSGLTQGG